MARTLETSVLIAGAGPAGMIAALAFATSGFKVVLGGPPANSDDRRTTAIMAPGLNYLAGLGIAEEKFAGAAPMTAMRIIDATGRLIRSPIVTFHAAEIGETRFGLNIPNSVLLSALRDAVSKTKSITRIEKPVKGWELNEATAVATISDGQKISTQLVIAADGRNSLAREAAGIKTRQHALPQSALVTSFAHTRGHGGCSTEFHTQTGPFTLVPLAGQRSSLVWVVRPEEAQHLLDLSDTDLAMRIEVQMQSMLGKVTLEPGRQIYPLSEVSASKIAASRVALVGEAAHVLPPIGAQGLNLGIRDIEDAVAVASQYRDDPGAPASLDAYARKRSTDIAARTGLVNLLNRSLLSNLLPAQIARSAGLSALRNIGPLRGFAMREGLRPGSGFSSLFSRSREQVRR